MRIAIDGAPGLAGACSRGEAAQVDALRLIQKMRPRARADWRGGRLGRAMLAQNLHLDVERRPARRPTAPASPCDASCVAYPGGSRGTSANRASQWHEGAASPCASPRTTLSAATRRGTTPRSSRGDTARGQLLKGRWAPRGGGRARDRGVAGGVRSCPGPAGGAA